MGKLREISPALINKRTVVAHLGSGASLCAMRGGQSVDTTMGFTPLDGLMMGTRCGAIDPGILLYLQLERDISTDDLQQLLYDKSGLLGISGISGDMRALLLSSDPRAAEAIELFPFEVAKAVCGMACTLGGIECLVFAGGIGEHAAQSCPAPARSAMPALKCQLFIRREEIGLILKSPADEIVPVEIEGGIIGGHASFSAPRSLRVCGHRGRPDQGLLSSSPSYGDLATASG